MEGEAWPAASFSSFSSVFASCPVSTSREMRMTLSSQYCPE